MQAMLRRKVLAAVKKELPKLTLTEDMIGKITIITLSALESALRKRTIFNIAKLFEHTGNQVKILLGLD
jgi:hypothetical protein